MAELLVQIEDVSKEYIAGAVRVIALQEISLTVERGEFLAIVGPSGSGKTTLLNLIGALDRPTRGRVVVDGIDLGALRGDRLADFRRERIGFVFQLFHLVPDLTALENVMLPLIPYRRQLKFNLEQRARALLEAVGLGNRMRHLPGQLSGGEQQRVAIARALIGNPRLLLADEPTGNLDSQTGKEIVELLRRLNREQGLTVIVTTHNPEIVAWSDRVVRLRDGRIVTA
ncbi:Lipoprotein-releasing system ATP-binding protein LolD [Candidatus Thermoflexus japonica]|uniref:Lipoprotein-releasing system ATP-binding protein LolD n=1 Tax=Candidatus Thermoflexus japonica TaxID=2035417 RepID=A0A2H5Y6M0_9CHLR|nr:Lipoprotein-releasing system ATP-binding protein LolD [Candidatus Thermoflexus japonica]